MTKFYRKDIVGGAFRRFVTQRASKGDFFDVSSINMFLEDCYLQFFQLGDVEFGYGDDDWDEAISDVEHLLNMKPDFVMDCVVIPGWKHIKKDKTNVNNINDTLLNRVEF